VVYVALPAQIAGGAESKQCHLPFACFKTPPKNLKFRVFLGFYLARSEGLESPSPLIRRQVNSDYWYLRYLCR